MGTRTMSLLVSGLLIASVHPAEAQYRPRSNGGGDTQYLRGFSEGQRIDRENERRWRESEAETRRLQREQLRQKREYEQSNRHPFGNSTRRY